MTTTNSNPKPKRRWFAFRLRTLFMAVAVVALPLACVGYSLNWIRGRKIALLESAWHQVSLTPAETISLRADDPPVFAPWQLRILGQRGARHVWLHPGTSRQRLIEVVGLFPEATVGIMRTDGGLFQLDEDQEYFRRSVSIKP